jgi:hypothetical protein
LHGFYAGEEMTGRRGGEMGGFPNMEEIEKLKMEIRDLDECLTSKERTEKEINEKQAYLRTLESSISGAKGRIKSLMESMDVESPGNYGHENRVLSLLLGFNRLAK